ncbi:MAG: DUF1826 domain-containing protein [Oligoflexus sp.]
MHANYYQDSFTLQSVQRIQADDRRVPSNAYVTQNFAEIDRIQDRDKNILIYHWQPSLDLQSEIANLAMNEVPNFDEVLRDEEIDALPSRFTHLPTVRLLTELKPSIAKLRSICQAKRYRFTLGVVADQMCPLFHVDRIRLRLLMTVIGPGTEWLADRDVNRKGLGKGCNSKIVKAGSLVQQLLPMQIGFLKGELFPYNLGRGIVHRSPAVSPKTSGRWFVRIDAVAD